MSTIPWQSLITAAISTCPCAGLLLTLSCGGLAEDDPPTDSAVPSDSETETSNGTATGNPSAGDDDDADDDDAGDDDADDDDADDDDADDDDGDDDGAQLQPCGTLQFGTEGNDWGFGITTDASNNVYVTGSTQGELEPGSAAGIDDVFVVKYTATGARAWLRQFGTSGNDLGHDVAVDDEGFVYIVGRTKGQLGDDPWGGDYDAFLAKYSPDGTRLWTRQLGSGGLDSADGVAIDATGRIYVTGYTDEGLDDTPSSGMFDVFVAAYAPDGTRVWMHQLGTVNYDYGIDVHASHDGAIYVVGHTKDELEGSESAGGFDIFVASYTSAGDRQWLEQYGTEAHEGGRGVVTDSSGSIYLAGSTTGSLDRGATTEREIVAMKLTEQGVLDWAASYGTTADDIAYGISIDDQDNVYLTGRTAGALEGESSVGDDDLFVTKIAPDGTRTWTEQRGTGHGDVGHGIALDGDGRIFVVGATGGEFPGNSWAGGDDVIVTEICD